MNKYYDSIFLLFLSLYTIFIIINELFIYICKKKKIKTDYNYFIKQICIKNNLPNELEIIINKYLY